MTKNELLQLKLETISKLTGIPTKSETIKTERGITYSNEYLKIDHYPLAGGYELRVVCKSTGERQFTGNERLKYKEFMILLDGIIFGLSFKN